MYDDWLNQPPDTPDDQKLDQNPGKTWQKELGASLKGLEKRFSIYKADYVFSRRILFEENLEHPSAFP